MKNIRNNSHFLYTITNKRVAVSETATLNIYSDKPCPRLSSDLWRRRGFYHLLPEQSVRMLGVKVKTVRPFADLTFTKFPNDVLDYVMPYVSPNAWKVLCLIMRKTTGWHKPEDDISYSQIIAGTGIISRSTVSAALRELLEQGMIISRKASRRAPVTYRLDTDYELSVTEIVRVVQKSNHSVVQESDTQKKRERNTKAGEPEKLAHSKHRPHGNTFPDVNDDGIHDEPSRIYYSNAMVDR